MKSGASVEFHGLEDHGVRIPGRCHTDDRPQRICGLYGKVERLGEAIQVKISMDSEAECDMIKGDVGTQLLRKPDEALAFGQRLNIDYSFHG
ncbi:hypothetical protein N9H39_03715 [Gammaproteobacteria bacterium]|nr:hypothetical protein [Gammaproteobacteria bacterium]